VIRSFTPTSGKTGTHVVLTGSNFTGTNAVWVGGVRAAAFAVNSPTRITLVAGGATRTGRIQLRTPAGLTTSAANFTFVPAPVIRSFTPATGKTGTRVVLTGNNFSRANAVWIGGVPAASFVVNSATRITAEAGSGSRSGRIQVRTPGGVATSAANFTFRPPPAISWFTPRSGVRGTRVVIYGTNFAGTTAVTLAGISVRYFRIDSPTQISLVLGGPTTFNIVQVTTPGGTAVRNAQLMRGMY
jgi:hypothetical protein